MAIIGSVLFIIGAIIALIFGVQILIMAFRKSLLWGLGYIFVPFVGLIFIISNWEETKGPFLKGLICIPFYIGGAALTAMSS